MDGDRHSKFETRILYLVLLVAVGGGGIGAYNAFSPQELAREDHDRIVRIEEQLISIKQREDANETRDAAQDLILADHGDRLTQVETHLDYLRDANSP